MKCRRHEWTKFCDCRDHLPTEERDCCCVGGNVCWVAPIVICSRCARRRAEADR